MYVSIVLIFAIGRIQYYVRLTPIVKPNRFSVSCSTKVIFQNISLANDSNGSLLLHGTNIWPHRVYLPAKYDYRGMFTIADLHEQQTVCYFFSIIQASLSNYSDCTKKSNYIHIKDLFIMYSLLPYETCVPYLYALRNSFYRFELLVSL